MAMTAAWTISLNDFCPLGMRSPKTPAKHIITVVCGLVGVRCSQGEPLALRQESSALQPGNRALISSQPMLKFRPTDERNLTALLAVPHPGIYEKLGESIGTKQAPESDDVRASIGGGRSRDGRPQGRKSGMEGYKVHSKLMDDNLSVFGKIVEIIRPLLHHEAALGEVLGVVVGGADFVAFVMGKLAFDPIGMEPHFV